MIAAVYCPCGIVISTFKEDFFLDIHGTEKQPTHNTVRIVGLPHTITFWNRYSLIYKLLDSYNYDFRLEILTEQLKNRWSETPSIATLMPYVKKMLMDNHVQLIGVMAGYESTENGYEPYVYQILGQEIYRVNRNEAGQVQYDYLCLEERTTVKKLLMECKLANGNTWEEYEKTSVRCDLFSIEKAIDFSKFMLATNRYVNHLNSVMYDEPLLYDMVIITPYGVKKQDE